MAIKIRLKRMGKKNTPFYRLVVVDSRWRRDGKSIADVGWYDPVKQPAQFKCKDEIYHWLANGAQVSETARSLLKKAGIWQRFQSGEYKQDSGLTNQTLNAEVSVEENQQKAAEASPAPAETQETSAESPEKPAAEEQQPSA